MSAFNMAAMAAQAKKASRVAAQLTTLEKNTLLHAIADPIKENGV